MARMAQTSLPIRLCLFIFLISPILPVLGQNCQLDFPGTSTLIFSGACGSPTVGNLELGDNINMGDGDTFTFDLPVVNIIGNLHIDVDGSGKIIIPAGVTVNVGDNVQLHNKNGECTSANPCMFEIVVNGTANFTDDLENDLVTLVWSGTGTVIVGDKLRNSNQGCMNCGTGGCPNIQANPSDCRDDGSGCAGGDFCTKINLCASDVIPPVISCPSDRVVNITGFGCSQSVIWTPPIASDNCGLQSLIPSHPLGSSFPKGLTVVTYTATDLAGNEATCSFNVTVVDNTPPLITGCSNITVNANASCQAVVNWATPGLIDNCPGGGLNPPTKMPGSTFNIGTTTVVYTATDAAGNPATCSFNVNVVDNTPPVLITGCPGNITVNANASCQAVVNWTAPSFTDNCGGVALATTKAPGSTFEKGTTTVVYTATDAAGKTATCSFNVTVEDKAGPTFQNCPADLVENVNSNCEAMVHWDVPIVTDNCGSVTITNTHNPNDIFPVGKTEVKYTAKDNLGNVSTCVFNVTVKNETLPVISNCPKDIVLKGNEMQMASADWVEPTASVICGNVTLTGSHKSGDFFPVGTTKVQYVAKDDGGNTAYCDFNVTVFQMEIEIGISKVVTPDGNGVNDQWILMNIEKFPNNKVVVVDRWGGLIFTGTQYNNGSVAWRGTNRNGEAVPTGTYFYSIFVTFGTATMEKTGFVELIR